MLAARPADAICSAQRSVGFNTSRCLTRIVRPSAAAFAPRRVNIQSVQAAADFEAPMSRRDDVYLSIGVSDSFNATVYNSWDLERVSKEFGLADQVIVSIEKYFPRRVLVVRVEDPSVAPAEGSKLGQGIYISKAVLLSRGSPAAVEEYLLSVFRINTKDGEAYVLQEDGKKRMWSFRVRDAPSLVDMLLSAHMFLVHDPNAKQ